MSKRNSAPPKKAPDTAKREAPARGGPPDILRGGSPEDLRGGSPDPPRNRRGHDARNRRGAAGQETRRAIRGGRPRTLVVGVTGASGAPYAVRLVECAVRAGRRIELIVTPAGRLVLADETPARFIDNVPDFTGLWPADVLATVTYTPAEDLAAPPASGSFDAEAAVILPCSMNTLAALACGLSANLVQRAGAVALKEGRPLVVVPREMPMTPIDLENMARLAAAGAIVMPAAPAFYHHPRSVADLVDFVVAKVLDRLGIAHELAVRWPGAERP